MPLEGHWERQNTPLRGLSRRERRILAPFAIVLVLSLAALGLFLIFDNGSESSTGCVDVTGASTLGAATYHACGRSAARFCRSACICFSMAIWMSLGGAMSLSSTRLTRTPHFSVTSSSTMRSWEFT